MDVSVVLCTFDPELFEDLQDAIDSVLQQTYTNRELIIVVDGSTQLYEQIRELYHTHTDIVIHCNEENRGLSQSRNVGIEIASGDIIAFLDDDAVARPTWLDELVETFERHQADAAGGKMVAQWVAGRPTFLPREFYWLIGVTHKGYPEEECEVRNTFGSNIAFRSEVLDSIGEFDPDLGRFGDRQIQGEETELAMRMRQERGSKVWYNPEAVVEHKIFYHRTQPEWLLRRAFWQGYSKFALKTLVDNHGSNSESEFLTELLLKFVPIRFVDLLRSPSREDAQQFIWLFLLTFSVGAGYLFASLRASIQNMWDRT